MGITLGEGPPLKLNNQYKLLSEQLDFTYWQLNNRKTLNNEPKELANIWNYLGQAGYRMPKTYLCDQT